MLTTCEQFCMCHKKVHLCVSNFKNRVVSDHGFTADWSLLNPGLRWSDKTNLNIFSHLNVVAKDIKLICYSNCPGSCQENRSEKSFSSNQLCGLWMQKVLKGLVNCEVDGAVAIQFKGHLFAGLISGLSLWSPFWCEFDCECDCWWLLMLNCGLARWKGYLCLHLFVSWNVLKK